MSRLADAVLLDLDGTVYQGGRPISGALAALDRLKTAGIPFRFVTNTTRRPRRVVLESLAAMGLTVRPEDCVTAPVAAARWLRKHGVHSILPLVAAATMEDLQEFIVDLEHPQAVLVGDLGTEWTFGQLDDAFRALHEGARLVAMQRNRFWRDGDTLRMDAGPFVAALEFAADCPSTIVGKPSREFFAAAAGDWDLPPARIAVVGDDLESDVAGARSSGHVGIAVRTGKFEPSDEARTRAAADLVIDSIAELPAALGA